MGRRRSSRPVGYAVGDVGFLFAFGKVGRDALCTSPAGILRVYGIGRALRYVLFGEYACSMKYDDELFLILIVVFAVIAVAVALAIVF